MTHRFVLPVERTARDDPPALNHVDTMGFARLTHRSCVTCWRSPWSVRRNSRRTAWSLSVLGLVLLLLLPVPGAAQEEGPLRCTLPEAIDRATREHPIMLAAREGLAELEAKLHGADLLWLPRLSFEGYFSVTPEKWGNPLEGGTNYDTWLPYFSAEVSAAMPIYTFGKIASLKEMARNGIDVGEAQVQLARGKVEQVVVEAYMGLGFAAHMGGVLEEGESYLRRAREYLEKLDAEDADGYDDVDMLRLKVFESEVASRRLEVNRLERLSLSALERLTGLPREAFLPAERLTPFDCPLKELDDYVATAWQERGEARALEALVRVQAARVDLEQSRFLPDLFIGGFFTYARAWAVERQESPFAYDPYNSWYAGAGLGLRISLDFAERVSSLDEAQATARKLGFQRAALRDKLAIEVEDSYLRLKELEQKRVLDKTAFKAARGWVIAKLDLYESGFAELKDLTDALAEFFKRRIAFEDTIRQYNLAVSALATSCGIPLKRLLPPLDKL